MQTVKLGIDAGGTLVKIAYLHNESIDYKLFSASQLPDIVSWINDNFKHVAICLTGGRALQLQEQLSEYVTTNIIEFDATGKGITYLLKMNDIILDSFVLTNVGTGTSIHYIDSNSQIRIGGTGVGGGTIIGLSTILTQITDFTQIVTLATEGNRGTIDLKVKDIYKDQAPPILGDLTASNFGKVHLNQASLLKKEDLLASIVGLVAETVVTTSLLAAQQYHTKHIVYIGSSFLSNHLLINLVTDYTSMKEARAIFVPYGEYSGAIGALFSI